MDQTHTKSEKRGWAHHLPSTEMDGSGTAVRWNEGAQNSTKRGRYQPEQTTSEGWMQTHERPPRPEINATPIPCRVQTFTSQHNVQNHVDRHVPLTHPHQYLPNTPTHHHISERHKRNRHEGDPPSSPPTHTHPLPPLTTLPTLVCHRYVSPVCSAASSII